MKIILNKIVQAVEPKDDYLSIAPDGIIDTLQSGLEKLSKTPLLLILCMLMVTGLVILVVALIFYAVSYHKNKASTLDGVMKVTVSINKPSKSDYSGIGPSISLGSYLVGMQDPEDIVENRLDPHRSWLQMAAPFHYQVVLLLTRFFSAYRASASSFTDPHISALLKKITAGDLEALGNIVRKNEKKGLVLSQGHVFEKDHTNPDHIAAYYPIPDALAGEEFADIKNLCIELEYVAPQTLL